MAICPQVVISPLGEDRVQRLMTGGSQTPVWSDRDLRLSMALEEKRTEFYPTMKVVSSEGYGFLLKQSTPLIRAVNRAKRKLLYNVYKLNYDFKSFQTLTFEGDEPSPENARKCWKIFMRKLRHYDGYKTEQQQYFARLERGETFGRLHFHVLFSERICPCFVKCIWMVCGGGYISDFSPVEGKDQVISYLLKYATKTQKKSKDDGHNRYREFNDLLSGKRFFYSQGMKCIPKHVALDIIREDDPGTGKNLIVGVETRVKHAITLPNGAVMVSDPVLIPKKIPIEWANLSDSGYDMVRLPPDPLFNSEAQLLLHESKTAHNFKEIWNKVLKIFWRGNMPFYRHYLYERELILLLEREMGEYSAPKWAFDRFDCLNIWQKLDFVRSKIWLYRVKTNCPPLSGEILDSVKTLLGGIPELRYQKGEYFIPYVGIFKVS